MYTFLINEDNTLTVSKRERIMERSKQVDTLHFLADTTYKGCLLYTSDAADD